MFPSPPRPLVTPASIAAIVRGPGPSRVSPSSDGPQEFEYMSTELLKCDRALAFIESEVEQAIRSWPAMVAPPAAPVTSIELLIVAAATPAAAVPCALSPQGVGSLTL